jgi:hypothetical protein
VDTSKGEERGSCGRKRFFEKNPEAVLISCFISAIDSCVHCCCFGGGAYQHCSHEGLLYSHPNGVPSFISRVAAHQAA